MDTGYQSTTPTPTPAPIPLITIHTLSFATVKSLMIVISKVHRLNRTGFRTYGIHAKASCGDAVSLRSANQRFRTSSWRFIFNEFVQNFGVNFFKFKIKLNSSGICYKFICFIFIEFIRNFPWIYFAIFFIFFEFIRNFP